MKSVGGYFLLFFVWLSTSCNPVRRDVARCNDVHPECPQGQTCDYKASRCVPIQEYLDASEGDAVDVDAPEDAPLDHDETTGPDGESADISPNGQMAAIDARDGPDETPQASRSDGGGAESVAASKGAGESCSWNSECRTGFCVDGVCCTSTCGQPCMTCGLPSALGICTFVPAGVAPSDPIECNHDAPASCGQDGTCDGKGHCRRYLPGTQCKAGQCEGDRVDGLMSCDGEGNCSKRLSQPCWPYSCNPATKQCAAACTSVADCSPGRKCIDGHCGPSFNGAACIAPGDCASGFCADGVCCDRACDGPCVSCNQPGSPGRCLPLQAGQVDPACPATPPSACGLTGQCDGLGSCERYAEGTVCGPSSCAGSFEVAPRTCDGHGACRPPQLVDCRPYRCDHGACQTTCVPADSGSCADGHTCERQTIDGQTVSICTGLRKNGRACKYDNQCESQHCVDDVCCESAWCGYCADCNRPGSPGRCANLPSGTRAKDGTCHDSGPSLINGCSFNGLCDGRGNCQRYSAGILCAKQGCVDGIYAPPALCNDSGLCVLQHPRDCGAYACNGDACHTSCSTDAECSRGHPCIAGSCGPKYGGADCTTGSECASGFCAQGVCCDSACSDACRACDLPSSRGICSQVPDRAPDPQGKCATSAPGSCGTSGLCLQGQCAYYDEGQSCADAVCVSTSSLAPHSVCDGKGNCIARAAQSCGPFTCDLGACTTGCTPATEAQTCLPVNACANNSCGLRPNGISCTEANQCESGHCTQGVCCDSECADASDGYCHTCLGTSGSAPGACHLVDNGHPDPNGRCTTSLVANGDCSYDGSCDGAGACRPWRSGTACGKETCVNYNRTLAAACDGKGNCVSGRERWCIWYACDSIGFTCRISCTDDKHCSGGATCDLTTNRCLP